MKKLKLIIFALLLISCNNSDILPTITTTLAPTSTSEYLFHFITPTPIDPGQFVFESYCRLEPNHDAILFTRFSKNIFRKEDSDWKLTGEFKQVITHVLDQFGRDKAIYQLWHEIQWKDNLPTCWLRADKINN